MRNKALITFGTIIMGCGIIIFILISAAKKQINHPNNFDREWLNNPILVASKNFTEPIYRIIGIDSSKVYLTSKRHGKIYAWNRNDDSIDTLLIPLPNDNKLLTGYDLKVDYPRVSVVAKNYAWVLEYEHSDSGFIFTKLTKLETTLITRSAMTRANNIYLRAFDTSRKYQEFQKIDLLTGHLQNRALPFDTKLDAGFSSDGMLLYDTSSSNVLYVQYYQNAFYCMDTSLNLRYKGKTIDTVSNTSIATRKTGDDKSGSLIPSTPLIPTNKTACVDGGMLYVMSLLQADNEPMRNFQNNTEIDVYKVAGGQYIGSFYLPNINEGKIMDFQINGGYLYAIYTQNVTIYTLKHID